MLLFVGGALGYWYYVKSYYGYKPLPYSKEAWAAAGEEERGYMLDDFLAKHELKGMSYDEVTALLGPGRGGSSRERLYYDVGFRGFNPRAPLVSRYTLIIEFDENGKVRDYIIND